MRVRLTDIFLVLAVVGAALIDVFPLPQNLALADVALAALIVLGARTLLVPGSDGRRAFRRLAPWLWLYLFGQLIGLGDFGITLNSLSVLARNVLPIVVLVALLGLCVGREERIRLGLRTYLATAAFVSVTLLVEEASGRASGLFGNPNYPAHFLVVGIIVVFAVRMSTWLRVLLLVLFAAGLFQTGSFMALMMLAGAGVYAAWQATRRLSGSAVIAIRSVLVLVAVIGLPAALASTTSAEFDAGSGFTSERLERSGENRLEVWRETLEFVAGDPTGLGPGGVRARGERLAGVAGEAHNDILDALIQGGVLGAVGLVGMVVVLWRMVSPGSTARLLLFALIVGSIFRQTWNFRHMWLALALLIALDLTQRRKASRTVDEEAPMVVPS